LNRLPLRDLARALHEEGFAVVPGVLGPEAIEGLRRICDALPPGAGGNPQDEELAQNPAVQELLESDIVSAALGAVLGERQAQALVAARMPRQGHGQQGLHCDVASREARAVSALVYLDDAGPENGGTRIVPQSHLRRSAPSREFADPAAHHPREQILSASDGAMLIFDAHLWHSGTRNRSGAPRRALQITWR
jgi:ectoine hydroxylase-related dioxygenase (phytanoyl-CoA dioxygenase family)